MGHLPPRHAHLDRTDGGLIMSDTLIKVEGVSKKFCHSFKNSLWYGMQDLGREITGHHHGGNSKLRTDEFWAIRDVSFELKRGECLGLIGRNGAGKTTLLKILNGLIRPDSGHIEIRGRVGALIALGAGFNPILTGRENIYVNGSVLGLSKFEIDENLLEIINFAELKEFIDTPVQNYSSGMVVRLGFAIASSLQPDILLLDEVLAVGDVNFRSKCYRRLSKLAEKGTSFIVVSHDEAAISRICNKVLLIDSGEQKYLGKTNEGIKKYLSLLSMNNGIESGIKTHNISNTSTCKIISIEIDNEKKNITGNSSVFTGHDAKIKLEYEVLEDITSLSYTIAIEGRSECANGITRLTIDTETQGKLTNKVSKGIYKTSIVLEKLGILPGTYTLKIGLWEKKLRQIAAIESYAFTVKSEKTFYKTDYAQAWKILNEE